MNRLKNFRAAKRLIAGTLIAVLAATGIASAQGDLSQQVLRLLDRANYWSAVQTFAHTVGVTLERGTAPAATTDTLYNVGGGLFWNGNAIATTGSTGTVTSVALSAPAIFSVGGSPVTISGTLAMTLATQVANRVWAGPATGVDATPTFRALVAADIPSLSAVYLTPAGAQAVTNKTGLISQWTNDAGYITSVGTITSLGTVSAGVWNATVIAGLYGGTGVANSGRTITLAGNITTAGAFTTAGANALTLTTTGGTNVTLPTSGTLVNSAVATLSSLTSIGTIATGVWNGTVVAALYGGTGQVGYAVGDVLYASGATALSKLADVATGNVLLSGGVTTAPAYGKVGLTTHISGVLPFVNGGTNLAAAADDTTLVSSGSAWVAAALPTCVLSYDGAANTFSCPTSIVLGAGAPTPSVTNVLVRSTVSAMVELMLGNASAAADLGAMRPAFGTGADKTFVADGVEYANIINTYAGGVSAANFFGIEHKLTLSPTGAMTGTDYGFFNRVLTTTAQNFASVIGALNSARPGGSGVYTLVYGAQSEGLFTGSGTITAMAAHAISGGVNGTGTVTTYSGQLIATPTILGGGVLTNSYGINIADQTVAGSTVNYAFIYNAPTSKEVIIKADGEVFIKALMTDGAASGKVMVCVDAATGQLFASSTDSGCDN